MLAYDFFPGNKERTAVLLHGLFGSARNLAGIANELTAVAQVYAYDARNHGRSEHTATHTLDDLTQDLGNFLREHEIRQPVLIGHSMGGLTAMNFARLYPQQVCALTVLDIAPRAYAPGHADEISAQKTDVSTFSTRKEVDAAMALHLADPTVRQFLQMNLARNAQGNFYWMNNVSAIENSPGRTEFPHFEGVLFDRPTLAIYGGRSDFVRGEDVTLMQCAFPLLETHLLADAQHWLHHTHRAQVSELIRDFMGKLVCGAAP